MIIETLNKSIKVLMEEAGLNLAIVEQKLL